MKNALDRDFLTAVIKNGHKYGHFPLSLTLHPLENVQLGPKFAFIVGRKSLRRAVDRNRLRRRVRAVVTQEFSRLKRGQGGAFFLGAPLLNYSYPALKASILSLLREAGIL